MNRYLKILIFLAGTSALLNAADLPKETNIPISSTVLPSLPLTYKQITTGLGKLNEIGVGTGRFADNAITQLYPSDVSLYWPKIKTILDTYNKEELESIIIKAIYELRNLENSVAPNDSLSRMIHESMIHSAQILRNTLGTVARQYGIPLPSTETQEEANSLNRPPAPTRSYVDRTSLL